MFHKVLPIGRMPYFAVITAVFVISLSVTRDFVGKVSAAELVFACSAENDLYRVVSDNVKQPPLRFDTPAEALREAVPGSAILILADGYPERTTDLPATLFDEVTKKNLRLYIEYPTSLPGIEFGKPYHDRYERAVIASDFFGSALPKLRILAINGMHVLPTTVENASMVAARVAGFDEAVYGLPEKTQPILFACGDGRILVSTTKLSHFVTGRYAPQDAWVTIWQNILQWLCGEDAEQPTPPSGDPPLKLKWKPATEPAYGRDEPLPTDAQNRAVRNGAEWFVKSGLLIPSTETKVSEGTQKKNASVGDGSQGIFEAPLSQLRPDGSQIISKSVRADCCCESAMALAFNGKLNHDQRHGEIAQNLVDFTYFTSDARKAGRGDPTHPAYGHIAWGMTDPAWLVANYGDDNARVLLATIAVSALTDEDRWDEGIMLCILANLRTTGPNGFRPSRIDMEPLEQNGWQHYYKTPCYHPSGHYQAYLWACYLWAYDKTGDKIFLDTAKRGISAFMAAYPDGVRWTNGLAQERARILLPLAWLVRVENTSENRKLLDRAIDGLLSIQAPCGAIREELGLLQNGDCPPPQSNEAYGLNEAPLIQANGDPVADMLYTTNFAILGLHEAAAATGDPKIREAEDRLAEFLCRIQVKSEIHPSLDGGWFRAFDFKRWEFWGSNADAGWGAWSIESGWTVGWITSVLAMREMDTSLWDLTKKSQIKKQHEKLREEMLPQAFVDANQPKQPIFVDHKAKGKSVRLACPPSPLYGGNGPASLTDGALGYATNGDQRWLGFEGEDLEAVIDLGEPVQINTLEINCLQIPKIGIFLPTEAEFAASMDGKSFSVLGTAKHTISPKKVDPFTKTLSIEGLDTSARFVRVHVKNLGTIPDWHHAAGRKSWLFVDEILIHQLSN